MTDVTVVHEALHAMGWPSVAPALGLPAPRRGERIPCPIHNGSGDNFTLDAKDGRLTWICASQCGAGDALELIRKLRGCGFREALAEAAGIAGIELDDGSEISNAERERRNAERAAYLAASQQHELARPKQHPPANESAALWDASAKVTTDGAIVRYLDSRVLFATRIAAHDVLRVIPTGTTLPRWASYRGRSERSRTWLETGHRLIMRTFDARGEFRGLRAWRVDGDEETPKRLPQAGFTAAGLVWGNRAAREILRGSGAGRLVICEGEPDACTHVIRGTYAVIGITSGSWTQEMADRVPFGAEVVIRTHNDQAGDKYAEHIRKTLRDRVALWRSQAA